MTAVPLSAPLRRPAFRRLASSYTVNELGNWLGEIALAILVFAETGSALATAGLFLSARFLPGLLAPALVTRLEGLAPRVSLPALFAGEALALAALAVVAGHFSLPVVLVLAGIDGLLASAARAITRATIGTVLAPSGELRAGNAIVNIGFTGAGALGPAMGGLMVAGFGVQAALLADAASFLLAGAALATASLPKAQVEAVPWRERLRGALGYVRSEVLLRRLLWAQAVTTVFLALVIPIEVVFAKETLGAGDTGFGLLLAAWGTGMAAGALIFARQRARSLWPLLLASTLAMGVSYLATAIAPTLALACAAAALGGAGNGVQWVALISAVQEMTADRYQARVLGVFEAVASAMPGLGFVVGGIVTALLSPRASYALAGAGVLILAGLGVPLIGRRWPKTSGQRNGSPAGDRLDPHRVGSDADLAA